MAEAPDRFTENETPLDETTMAELREIAGRYPQPRSGLLPMLHLVQSVEGRITPEGIEACAQVLGISSAQVSGVATFYTQYKRHPNGEYTVGVCTNTLCAIMGGDQIFDEVSEHLGIGHDETTEDGKITLERLECNAACDFAPVVMVNWEFFDNQTPESARPAGRRPARRQGGPLDPRPAPGHLEGGEPRARRLRGRSRRRGSSGRPSLPGGAEHRRRAGLDGPRLRRGGRHRHTDGRRVGQPRGRPQGGRGRGRRVRADTKHEDDPDTKQGDAK